jgi:hypothetical protein
VEVEWRKITPGFMKDIHFDNATIIQSHDPVFIKVNGISRKGSHDFIFTTPGYHPSRFVFAHGEGWCLSPDKTNVTKSNFSPVTNPIVIPMQPANLQDVRQ